MKRETLDKFVQDWDGAEACVDTLRSHQANLPALEFLKLVCALYPQRVTRRQQLELCESPDYQALLIKSIETGRYEEVEQYIVRALDLKEPMEDVRYSVTEPSQFADVFKAHYVGTAAADLYWHLGQLQREFVLKDGHYYAKFCSIVQSSGTGKSRALIELKDQGALVVYLNLRSKQESGNPYPDRDEIPAKILTEDLDDCSEKEYNRRCTAFLTALFLVLRLCLLKLWKEGGTREGLVKAWSERMCDMTNDSRERFFLEVDKVYHEILGLRGVKPVEGDLSALPMTPSSSTESTGKGQSSAEPASKHKPSAQPASKGQPSVQSASKDQHSGESASKDSKPGDGVPKPKLHGESAMRQAYIDLFKAIPAIFNTGSNSPSLVVAMDEAHPLREPQKHFLPSHILTRAISSLSQSHPEVPFWFVFASTTSKVADFSAPADMHASSRVSIGGKLLFPPYYDFGWDQYGLALAAVEPEKVAQFSHIVRLGRPLWYSLAESNMEVSQVLQTAGQKLCGQSKFEPSNLHHVLAVVGQRFLLDICLGSHDWLQFHQIGVSSHLRVCLWTSEDRKLMETAYPSEPLLSNAAARLLYPPAVPITSGAFLSVLGATLGQLQVAVASRIIDQGLKGELVSRLIFLTAKDITTRKYHAASSVGMSAIPSMSEELLDCKPLPVIEYLTVLFGENTVDQEARRLFDGWHVNFSHWIGMDQNIAFQDAPEAESNSGAEFNPVTEMQEWLLCLWTRTSAVQCCHGQHSFDKVIPMYRLRKPSEPRSDADPDAGRVSFILISDKNKGQAATKYAVGNVTPQNSRLPTLGQPYVAILADLGAAEEPTISKTHGQRSALWIHAFGSGPRTYPFLTGTIADVVRDILHMWHPRDDPSPSQERLKELVRFSRSSERSARRWWEHSK